MKTLIRDVRLVLEHGIRENAWLTFADGHIAETGGDGKPEPPADRIVEGRGLYLAPGLIDLHLHGGTDMISWTGRRKPSDGSPPITAPMGSLPCLRPPSRERKRKRWPRWKTSAGSFLRSVPAIFWACIWRDPISARVRGELRIRSISRIRIRPSANVFCRRAASEGSAWRRSFPARFPWDISCMKKGSWSPRANSEIARDGICEAYDHGFRLMTHLYSGMQGVHRKGAFRYGGAVEGGLLTDGMAVELISDGCHLPGCLLKLVRRCKRPEEILLITDAMRGAGLKEGEWTRLGSLEKGQKVIIEDGVAKMPDRTSFAGSVASGDRVVRTMRDLGGAPLHEAVAMMTANPARLLGLADRKGGLRPGMDADLILFDGEVSMQTVWVGGECVFSADEK